MKKVDFNKLQAGDLVEVPRTQFAPMRRGWDGIRAASMKRCLIQPQEKENSAQLMRYRYG